MPSVEANCDCVDQVFDGDNAHICHWAFKCAVNGVACQLPSFLAVVCLGLKMILNNDVSGFFYIIKQTVFNYRVIEYCQRRAHLHPV